MNLAFGFILKNTEDGGLKYFYAHENITLLDRFELVSTRDDLAKLKDILNKIDVIESYSRERMNIMWSFYKLTKLNVFADFLQDVPMGCMDAVLPEPVLPEPQSTVSRTKKIQDNHISTTCVFFVLLLSNCTETNDWKKKHLNCSIYSSINWMD